MADWMEKPLGDITTYMAKGIPPKYVSDENENTIWVLNQKCNRNFVISYSEARLHNNTIKKVSEKKMLKDGDVLINSTGTGTAGRVAQIWDVHAPTTIDGHMILLRSTKEIDPLYYGYAVKSYQAKIESLAEGSTGQTEINRSRLKNEVIIRYPSDLKLQHIIGRFLLDLDEEIRINDAVNNHLASMSAVDNSPDIRRGSNESRMALRLQISA